MTPPEPQHRMRLKPVASSTAKARRSPLLHTGPSSVSASAYAWAVEQGYTPQNPFAAVKPVGKPKVGKSQLRIDEARRFVSLAIEKAQQGDRAATCALMALMLGMRASEVLCRIVRDPMTRAASYGSPAARPTTPAAASKSPRSFARCFIRSGQRQSARGATVRSEPHRDGKPLTDAWLWGHVQKLCNEAGFRAFRRTACEGCI